MENEKFIWAIFHCYDEDGGYGDAVPQEVMVGSCMATEQEIEEFLQKWDKPEVYDHPYDDLVCHGVRAEKIDLKELKDIKPYGDDYFEDQIQDYKLKQKYNEKYGDDFYFRNPQAAAEYCRELWKMREERNIK